MTRIAVCVILAAMVVAMVGCGSDVDRAKPRPIADSSHRAMSLATESVEVTEIEYHGWKALRMANGLVVVVAVPEIGGRIMEYKLNGHPFLWTNPEEYGRTYPAPKTESERTWHNFGGYKVWPAPQSEWGGPGDPVGSELDGGKWTGEIVKQTGQVGEITLTSPPDPAVTGLQVTRTVKLFAGTTRVEVGETFANVSDRDIEWSVWDVTQVPGSLRADVEVSNESRIYFPLNPKSKFETGYTHLIDSPEGDGQFSVMDDLGLMRVSYEKRLGKVGADSFAGWIAHTDEIHNMAYIKRFDPAKLRDYPDKGSVVEVYTSDSLSYMEVEVLSPLMKLKPGAEETVTRDWLAAAMPGPVVDTGEVSAVNGPLVCTAGEDGKVRLSGIFGVFVEGTVALSEADAEGKAGKQVMTFPASPATPLAIQEELEVSRKAKLLVLDLKNANGTPVGRIASVEVPVVEKPEVAETAEGTGEEEG